MFYLGLDVSKASLDCCLLYQGIDGKKKNKRVANSSKGTAELLDWLKRQQSENGQTHIVMEATGVYHENTAIALHRAGCLVSIVNPAHVRHFAKSRSIHTKTDKVDSEVLAYFAAANHPELWQPPSPEALLLKALLSRHDALTADLLREKNRLEKAEATHTPPQILASIHASIIFISAQIACLQKEQDDHIDGNPQLKEDMQLLQSIPAIGERTGAALLCVMHTHHFEAADQLAAFLGVVPVERQSGTSLAGRAHLSKIGPAKIRAKLYMAALSAMQYNPHVKALYDRLLLKGKSKMSALGAAMRKLVLLCFGVLMHRRPYQADYLPKIAV